MCTVTFILKEDHIYLSSNRDEMVARPTKAPEQRRFGSGTIIFPQDGLAGGTWMAMHENRNAMVLLNGARERHIHQPPYRKSRGLVFLDIFDHDFPASAFEDIDLSGIEPFTLVIWQQGSLWQARWDGQAKELIPCDPLQPHIWSSATLYDPEVIHKREQWFQQWLDTVTEINTASITSFHEFAGEGNEATDLRMNRDGILQTVSISNITMDPAQAVFRYHDLLQDTTAAVSL